MVPILRYLPPKRNLGNRNATVVIEKIFQAVIVFIILLFILLFIILLFIILLLNFFNRYF